MASIDERRSDVPPDPRTAETIDGLMSALGLTRVWAGTPSFRELTRRANRLRADRVAGAAGTPVHKVISSTVHNLFEKADRQHLNHDLLFDLLTVMGLSQEYLDWWRQAWAAVHARRDPARGVNVEQCLPADPADFVARTGEVAQITDLGSAGDAGVVVVTAIEGMAGVGKTYLAVHAAHELIRRGRFTDLQLYVNLRGFDPAGLPPADPDAVLEALLRVLRPRGALPATRERRIRAYRNLLSARNVLILLDNAASEEQVRDLLPDTPTSLVIITSRWRLNGLLPEAVSPVTLDVLDVADAVDLLCRVGHLDPAVPDRDVLAQIAERCGYLPLALTIIGSHIREHREWTLLDHLSALQDVVMHGGVEAALAVSYTTLPADWQRLLRLLGTSPCQDTTAYAAAAVANSALDHIDVIMQGLADAHLLQVKTGGRYELHDLVRTFARNRAHREEPASAQHSALTRQCNLYLHTASLAMDRLVPQEAHRRPQVVAASTPAPDLVDETAAHAWLDSERANLIALAAHAADHGVPIYPSHLSAILFRYLDTGAHWHDAETLHTLALRTAAPADQGLALAALASVHLRLGHFDQAEQAYRQALTSAASDDHATRARALSNLGLVYRQQGQNREALKHLQRALAAFREADDRDGIGRALGNVGVVYRLMGRYHDALDYTQQALEIAHETNNPVFEGRTLNNLGLIHQRLGHHEQALDLYHQVLDTIQRTGDRADEGSALGNIGVVHERLGHPRKALEYLQRALAIFCATGDRDGKADALSHLGIVYQRLHRSDVAIDHHQQALAIITGTGNRRSEAKALNDKGQTLRRIGRLTDAINDHQTALRNARDLVDLYEQARAHNGLGNCHHDLHQPNLACEHWRKALRLYTTLQLPEADLIRHRLHQA